MNSKMTVCLVAAAALLAVGPPAWAGVTVPDHLRCVKVKDKNLAKARYTADLASIHPSFPSESGCLIKVPAKLYCFPVGKRDADPTPPEVVTGQPIIEQLVCYKLKCPKQELAVPVADQFGSRTLSVSAPKILCAPTNFD
jgi:hypothetical protein